VIRRRLESERGSALVAAILVMTTIIALGMAMMATVDTQSRQSGSERGRESSFNWSESVLNARTFTVGQSWPARADQAVADCTWSGSGPAVAATSPTNPVAACPDPSVIASTFGGNVDVGRGARWTTQVRDNPGTSQCEDSTAANATCSYTWNEATSPNAAHWDANGDNLVWLRADGTVNSKRRVVVALVRIQNDPVELPQSVLVAGSLSVQGGNKWFIRQGGSAVTLRCPDLTDDSCYYEQKPGVNVEGPGTKQPGYDDGGHILSSDDLDLLRHMARDVANPERYYEAGTCPTSAQGMSGDVVFIENANCTINANWQVNSPSKPGLLVVNQGTLRFNGTMDFYGVIYMYNAQGWGPDDDALFDGTGNGFLHGSLLVDGQGKVENGGAWNLEYNPSAASAVTTFGAAGIVPNSFREVNP
jgi:Tfp pilus assembly protein PilX